MTLIAIGNAGVEFGATEIFRDISLTIAPGDRWAVCAGRWLQSYEAGIEAPVILAATHQAALAIVPAEALEACAADVPDDASDLLG